MAYYRRSKSNKYGARKAVIDGEMFDSRKEARRWQELRLMERKGLISNLQRQVKFELIPNQYEPTGEYYVRGEKKGQPKQKLIERSCVYVADFVYRDSDGKQIVEDTKGIRTKEYIIKRKLMFFVHKIKIKEI